MFNRKDYGCQNNPENESATNVDEHIPLGFTMSTTISSCKTKEGKNDAYRCFYR